ncbi:MAG: ECF-type sigma factor, partial [Anaerolineales bacterium]|nr:ECF-type sigma factor [Anaerolineales bacterium]
MDQITQDLQQALIGDDDAIERVWLALHSDIRTIASRLMAGESPTPTLQPTVLINEAYLKLFGGNV